MLLILQKGSFPACCWTSWRWLHHSSRTSARDHLLHWNKWSSWCLEDPGRMLALWTTSGQSSGLELKGYILCCTAVGRRLMFRNLKFFCCRSWRSMSKEPRTYHSSVEAVRWDGAVDHGCGHEQRPVLRRDTEAKGVLYPCWNLVSSDVGISFFL